MDKEVKAKWLTALRSGEYKQGKNRLCDYNGAYCCLGVLAKEMGWFDPDELLVEGHGGYLPMAKAHIVGIVSQQRILSIMNDNGNSFLEIADWIEANL